MAISSGRVTIGSNPVMVVPELLNQGGGTVLVRNRDEANSVFLNGESVTVANGFELKHSTTVSIPISPTDPLYAVAASGVRVDIDYLVTGR